MNVTNLHFHGLTISPKRPQDDVLDLMAMPGESIDYTLEIPRDHPPGLHWYHTHARESPAGARRPVGALVIEGIERYAPQYAISRSACSSFAASTSSTTRQDRP